jgi:alpha-tubulin suppressor-like RCC1 family protein
MESSYAKKKKLLSLLFCIAFCSLHAQNGCWKQINVGQEHALAIKTDGTLWAWGWNGYGQLGNGTLTDSDAPIQIGTASDWKQVAAGGAHSSALKNDGTLWSWGGNTLGILGIGTDDNVSVPSYTSLFRQ